MIFLMMAISLSKDMNGDDYDEDGNNIVPCPICGSVHCPGKDDGVCPEEEDFVKSLEADKKLKTYGSKKS